MDYLEAMRQFVAAADGGSFSQAAAEAGVKVSTVSRHVAALESDLGAALFNRSTRRLHLTEAGRLFLDRARRVLEAVEEAREATRAWNGRPQGVLKVAVPGALGRLRLVPAVPSFQVACPDIQLDLLFEDGPVDPIARGLDAVIRVGVLPDSALIGRKLAAAPMVLAGAPEVMGRLPAVLTPEGLAGVPGLWLRGQEVPSWQGSVRRSADPHWPGPVPGPEPGPGHEHWHWRSVAGAQGVVVPRVVLAANDVDALHGAALAGLGLCLLPRWIAQESLSRGALVPVLPELAWGEAARSGGAGDAGIWLLYPPKRIVSPKLRAFMAFSLRVFGAEA